tara:strand:- start:8359 stop:8574 length:216 start_codon:yes stop_codon:yes gene_type:complete
MQKFRIPAGILAEVSDGKSPWRDYRTTKETTFDEPIGRTRSHVTFQRDGWQIRVKPMFVEIFTGVRWQKWK